jgi:hypothetical protein
MMMDSPKKEETQPRDKKNCAARRGSHGAREATTLADVRASLYTVLTRR